MDRLRDGTVVPDGLLIKKKPENINDMGRINFPVCGFITKIYTLDNEDDNVDGETLVCDVTVNKHSLSLYAVPFLLDKADYDNYVYYGPIASSRNLDMMPYFDQNIEPAKQNGTTVLVQFVDGLISQPVITKVFPHNASGRDSGKLGFGFSPDPRPGNEADGDVFKVRYNGTNFMIDKDGNVEIKQTKMTDDFSGFSRPNHKKTITFELQDPIAGGEQVVSFLMDNSGSGEFSLGVTDILGKSQTIDMAGGSTTITSEGATGSSEVTLTGQVIDIKNSAGDEIKIDPTSGIKAKTSTGATLNLKAGMVGLGSSSAELLDLLDKILQQLDSLCTALSSETHLGNMGYATSPPLNAAQYATAQTQLGLLKTQLGLIKGGI